MVQNEVHILLSPMSRTFAVFLSLLQSAFLAFGFAQNCELSGTPAWSNQVKVVI
jgi:hypothetical protein